MAKQAFGAMDANLVNTVNKTNKNYNSEILSAGMDGFAKGAQPAVDKFAANKKKYDSIMSNFTEVSQIPTMDEEERTSIQPIVDEASKKAQDFARELVNNPSSLKAQAGFNESLTVMNRISGAQTEKYKSKVDASIVHKNNDYSPGQDPTELSHAKEIVANTTKRSFSKDGYETFVTSDNVTYDNDPHTNNPPPPKVQGTFKLGHATALASFNENVTKNETSAKLTDAVTNWNADGAATDLYNTFLTSGADGAAPTHGEKVDLFFNDISGDGTDVKYSDMFINGELDDTFYKDQNGDPITLNGKPISDYPDSDKDTSRINEIRKELESYDSKAPKYISAGPGRMDKIKNPDYRGNQIANLQSELDGLQDKFKSPAGMQDFPEELGISEALTKKDALEKYLRSQDGSDDNLRKFSKFYSNATKSALDAKREKVGNDEGTMLKINGEATYFNDKKLAQVKKKELYMSMSTDNSISSFQKTNVIKDGKDFVVDCKMDKSIEKMFRNVPGMQIRQGVSKKNGAKVITVNTSVSTKSGKGTGKQLVFNVDDANDMKQFKMMMQNNAPQMTNMPDLNGYPETWFPKENPDGSGFSSIIPNNDIMNNNVTVTEENENKSNGNGFGGFSSGRF